MPAEGLSLIYASSPEVFGTGASGVISSNGSVTFSSVWKISLNGVFSNTFDNYKIIMSYDDPSNSVSAIWQCRLRSSGVDDATANSYTYQSLYAGDSSTAASRVSADSSSAARIRHIESGFLMNIYNPYQTLPTFARTFVSGSDISTSDPSISEYAWSHNRSLSYDGISFFLGSSSPQINGFIAVYGMGK